MSDPSIIQKMAANLRKKIESDERNTRCGRIDMELADYEMVGPHDAKIMIEYSRERGAPTATQVNECVTASFNGHFRLNLATLRDHPEIGAMTGIMRENQIPMQFERSASMLKIGGSQFLDKDKNTWAVEETDDGQKFLVRANDVNIEDMLEERISRQRDGRYARLSLGMVRTAGVYNLEVGDTVLYTEPAGGQLQKVGELSSVSKQTVSIKGREGSLPRSYVVDIIDKNPATKAKQQEKLINFWAENLFAGDKSIAKKMK
jgi:hypothetical protein